MKVLLQMYANYRVFFFTTYIIPVTCFTIVSSPPATLIKLIENTTL